MRKSKLTQYIAIFLLILFLITSLLSCSSHTHVTNVHTTSKGKVPPGHAKKMTGSKSAKKYAPGHRK